MGWSVDGDGDSRLGKGKVSYLLVLVYETDRWVSKVPNGIVGYCVLSLRR